MNVLHPSVPRFDVFQPGDKTALVCMDVPEMERLVVQQLGDLGYKIHTGLSVEDIIFKMRAHPYDVIVIAENFAASDVGTNPLIAETIATPASQRHQQLVALVGASLTTASEAQAFQCSVDVVVNLSDIMNIRPVLRRAVDRMQDFYSRYLEAITAADLVE
jgi:CheY-like chemotaxis protein